MAWLIDRFSNRQIVTLEEIYEHTGFQHILGVGIVGKQAWAGPICIASVLLPIQNNVKYTYKISKLSEEEQAAISLDIRNKSIHTDIAWGTIYDTENKSLDFALRSAFSSALRRYSDYYPVSFIVTDNYIPDPLPNNLAQSDIPIFSVKGASSYIEPVIAATIIARAARSVYMDEIHQQYPQYCWNQNKGYITHEHKEMIDRHGLSIHHRKR